MKVAIYHPWVYVKSGLERTILELTRRSRHQWTIYTSHFDPEGTYPELRDLGVVELDRVSVRRSYGSVLAGAARMFRTRLPLEEGQPLVICCDGLGSLLNFRHRSHPLVCLCFTPLRAVYDAEYRKRHLQKHWLKLPAALAMEAVYRVLDRRAWRHYDKVFCISETVRQRVLQGKLASPDRIEIAFPGIPEENIRFSDQRERYFFLPGRIMWTKNLELGIDAFRTFVQGRQDGFRLVIAGMVDEKSRPYFARLRESASDCRQIEFVCDPSDSQMQDLYRRCYAVLFTAFNEDLGLTPLEGMACGKPAIAVARGGPTEIVRDGRTGRLCPPEPASFAQAMRQLADDAALTERMGREGLERSRLFTWSVFVERIDAYLDGLEAARTRA